MFNFQKEVVINSADQYKVVDVATGGAGKPKIDKKLRVHDGGEYFDKYFVDHKIYKTNPNDGSLFTLDFDMGSAGDLTLGGAHIQILVELGLDNDYRGDYGSALWYFRKPLLVDVVLSGTPASDAEILEKAFNAAIPDQYKFVTVSKSSNKVSISGVDTCQKVRKVVVSKYECEERCGGNGSEEPIEAYNLSAGELKESSGFIAYTPNSTEIGTYNYLLHNLRLPTYENLRFTSPSVVEMPIRGAKYVQYSFAYSVPRVGFGGLSVVGQTVQSTTVHTFYVLESVSSDFEAKLAELNASFVEDTDIEVIDRGEQHEIVILPDSQATTSDLAAVKAEVKKNTAKNSEQDSSIAAKADAANVYTKSEVYQKSETYSKSEADGKFQTKA